MKKRCPWAGSDPIYTDYHDREWGLPLYDDRRLFEFLILEGAQAGLSWITILKRRDNYRKAFHDFDPEIISRYSSKDIDRLRGDAGIIRNRLKIESAIKNAAACLKVTEEFGSFNKYLWSFVDGRPIKNAWRKIEDVPDQTSVSQAMSRDLKKRGFSFVGPTICYAFMQAVGMVNDHLTDCFRYNEV